MTTAAQQVSGETPAVARGDNKRFELCNCQRAREGKVHGYFVRGQDSRFPAVIVSVRAGKFVLDGAPDDGFITAEDKARMISQMEASGLPAERDGDIEAVMASARASMDPLEMLLAILGDDLSERKQE